MIATLVTLAGLCFLLAIAAWIADRTEADEPEPSPYPQSNVTRLDEWGQR